MRRYREDPDFRQKMITRAADRAVRKLREPAIRTRADLIAYLTDKCGGRCGICGSIVADDADGLDRASPDHIIPLSRGGPHTLANLQLSHLGCNYAKGNRAA